MINSIVIGIAGGTGSGKSTFTNRIKDEFGDSVSVIYQDNYYKCQDNVPFEERKKINYDHPDALQTELLVRHIKELKHGKPIYSPLYDYSQHNRSVQKNEVKPSKIIIVEGILVLQDEQLCELIDIKIYVEADADERILRRALRDMEERDRDFKGIVEQYLTTVKPMHYLYVEPTKAKADIVINSGMNNVAFDLIKTKIYQLLEKISEEMEITYEL